MAWWIWVLIGIGSALALVSLVTDALYRIWRRRQRRLAKHLSGRSKPIHLFLNLSADPNEWKTEGSRIAHVPTGSVVTRRSEYETYDGGDYWWEMVVAGVTYRLGKGFRLFETSVVTEFTRTLEMDSCLKAITEVRRAYYEQKIAEYDAEQEQEGVT